MIDREVYFDFLEDLRQSGVTNMFGAGPYLEEVFGLSEQEAQRILIEWMRSKEQK